jgi:hypothetical protein
MLKGTTLLWLAAAASLAHAEPCRTVHGRMALANGAPSVRIWVMGTHRILGVVQPHERFDDLPANVRALWSRGGDEAMWATDLYGDFRVCPAAPSRPGRMQMVTLVSATKLVAHRRGATTGPR